MPAPGNNRLSARRLAISKKAPATTLAAVVEAARFRDSSSDTKVQVSDGVAIRKTSNPSPKAQL